MSNRTISQETLSEETLEGLARKVEQCANEADDKTLQAALGIRELRRRIEAGELGEDIRWYEWARENIKLSESRLRELQRISQADDPAAELKRLREINRERQERHRARQKAAPLRNGAPGGKKTAEEPPQDAPEPAEPGPQESAAHDSKREPEPKPDSAREPEPHADPECTPESEREALLRWARSARIDQVKDVWAYARSLDGGETTGPDEAAVSADQKPLSIAS